MKQIQLLLLSFLLLSIVPLSAQKEETVLGDRKFGFSGIWGGYKHQLSQFNNETSYLNGGFFGLEFGKSLLLGWGHYSLVDEFPWQDAGNQEFDMRWRPFLVQYGFQNYKAIHPQIGFEIGRGRVELGDQKERILVMQPSAGVEINLLRWLHLGFDGGYRFVSDVSLNGLSDEALSGWYGQASLKFGFSWGRYRGKKTERKPVPIED